MINNRLLYILHGYSDKLFFSSEFQSKSLFCPFITNCVSWKILRGMFVFFCFLLAIWVDKKLQFHPLYSNFPHNMFLSQIQFFLLYFFSIKKKMSGSLKTVSRVVNLGTATKLC